MASAMASETMSQQPTIAGISLDVAKTGVEQLSAHTNNNFLRKIRVLQESNTKEGILRYFLGEVDELLEYLTAEVDQSNKEEAAAHRVNVVAELGDLVHFWNDMLALSDASIAALLSSIAESETHDSGDDLTIRQMMKVAVEARKQDQAQEKEATQEAIALLNQLKEAIKLIEDEEINVGLIGVIASHIFAVASILDINPIYAVLMKNIRNRQKYRSGLMNFLRFLGFNYDQITKFMVRLWNGGDTKFFKEFLEQFPIEWSYVVALQLAEKSN